MAASLCVARLIIIHAMRMVQTLSHIMRFVLFSVSWLCCKYICVYRNTVDLRPFNCMALCVKRRYLITLDKRLTYHNRESSAHVIYCLLFDNNSNIKSSTDFWHKFIVLQAVNRAQNYKTQLMSSYRSPKIYHHIRSNAQSPNTNEIFKNFN